MAYILHIDTSGAGGLVMLAHNGTVKAVAQNEAEREHAGTINGMIDAVLAEAGIELAGLAAIAVCSGPGSYTGLRIGMATAKGICYALDIPLMLHNKLELLAGGAPAGKTMVLLPARAGEYFAAAYDHGMVTLPPRHATTAEVLEMIRNEGAENIIGNLEADVTDVLKIDGESVIRKISWDFWAAYSLLAFRNKQFTNTAQAEPFYLKQVFIHKKKTD